MAGVNGRRTAGTMVLALLALAFALPVGANARDDNRAPDVGDYTDLWVPEGNKVCFHTYAEGVQVYRWNGASWDFMAPEAWLYAGDGEDDEPVGIHYAGPTWESASGSKVIGTVAARATPDSTAIPWLKLQAVSSTGPGIFDGVTFIQRVNTVGGKAPGVAGEFVGQFARVPYLAEYYFYRKSN
jgi:Protein of unknown function (DUF3455)